MNNLVNLQLNSSLLDTKQSLEASYHEEGVVVLRTLNQSLVDFLKEFGHSHTVNRADLDGFDSLQGTGTLRCRAFSKELANYLFELIKGIPSLSFAITNKKDRFSENCPEGLWELEGVNPLMRFIKYSEGFNTLNAHYDASYVKDYSTRSLRSVILYLSDCNSGSTLFFKDGQSDVQKAFRDYSDRKELLTQKPFKTVACQKGSIAVFAHRILHQSQQVAPCDNKLIIRTDLMYRYVNC